MASQPRMPSSFERDDTLYEPTIWQRITRRLRQEPLIPIGCVLTCWALYEASKSMRRGDHARTNRMFRRRIYGQAFTVLAMCGGSFYWAEDREKRKSYSRAMAEQAAQEKRAAWLRELEARDREAEELRQKRERARGKKAAAAAAATAAAAAAAVAATPGEGDAADAAAGDGDTPATSPSSSPSSSSSSSSSPPPLEKGGESGSGSSKAEDAQAPSPPPGGGIVEAVKKSLSRGTS